jgi:hypothetical protein
MTVDYRVYGLTLRANRPLPHLYAAPLNTAPAEADVVFEVHGESGEGAGELVRLTYTSPTGRLDISVDPAGGHVRADLTEALQPRLIDGLASMLAGPVLGGLLRLRGTVSLHGSVVDVDSRAAVLLGAPGAGKSTIAAAIAHAGGAVLSDDVAALVEEPAGGWSAQPGYPRLRLRPATIDAIDGLADRPDEASPVFNELEKRYLKLSTDREAGPWRFQTRPLIPGGIYELHRDPAADRPRIEPVDGVDRLTTLVRHTRRAIAPLDAATRSAELARLGRLAASVPLRRLIAPDDLEALPDVCRAIAADVIEIAARV